ncbi:hypothetical protein D3C86_1312590 [compost metagenome]
MEVGIKFQANDSGAIKPFFGAQLGRFNDPATGSNPIQIRPFAVGGIDYQFSPKLAVGFDLRTDLNLVQTAFTTRFGF